VRFSKKDRIGLPGEPTESKIIRLLHQRSAQTTIHEETGKPQKNEKETIYFVFPLETLEMEVLERLVNSGRGSNPNLKLRN